jgi:hypothetical protein
VRRLFLLLFVAALVGCKAGGSAKTYAPEDVVSAMKDQGFKVEKVTELAKMFNIDRGLRADVEGEDFGVQVLAFDLSSDQGRKGLELVESMASTEPLKGTTESRMKGNLRISWNKKFRQRDRILKAIDSL